MKIRMLWLYHDLLDLYGDSGNLLMLSRRLGQMGVESEIDRASLGDTPDFASYNLVYIGPGKEKNLEAASRHFAGLKESLASALKSGTLLFVTGNARLLLGKSFRNNRTKAEFPGAGFFDYTGFETGDVFVSDVICREPGSSDKLYGFINRTSYIEGNNSDRWFETLRGAQDADKPGTVPGTPASGAGEGNRKDNILSTWLLGPVLVKNPPLCREMLARLCPDVEQKYDDSLAVTAWKRTLDDYPEGR